MMFVGPTSKDPLLLVGTLQHVGRTIRAQAEGTKDIDSVGVCAHHRKGTVNIEDVETIRERRHNFALQRTLECRGQRRQ